MCIAIEYSNQRCRNESGYNSFCPKHYELRRMKKSLPYVAEKKVKVCIIDDCNMTHHALGYCRRHYDKLVNISNKNKDNEMKHKEMKKMEKKIEKSVEKKDKMQDKKMMEKAKSKGKKDCGY